MTNNLNVKNATSHYGKIPTLHTYYLRILQGQFCGIEFLVSFLKMFREMN